MNQNNGILKAGIFHSGISGSFHDLPTLYTEQFH